MATAKRFEDLAVWKASLELATAIYGCTRQASFSRDFGLCDQIRRAAVSVVSNIAEGFERDSDGEFARFLSIAKGSAGEIRAQLHVAKALGYLDADSFSSAKASAESISRSLSRLISYLKTTRQS